jgi:hypothetical protein
MDTTANRSLYSCRAKIERPVGVSFSELAELVESNASISNFLYQRQLRFLIGLDFVFGINRPGIKSRAIKQKGNGKNQKDAP